MCVGTPVQVVRSGEVMSLCRGRNGDEDVNMLLVGQQPTGTWVLAFLGWAREILDEQQAKDINLALDGMQLIMDGAQDVDVARYFPGLDQPMSEVGR